MEFDRIVRCIIANQLGGFLCTQARPAVFNDLAASCDPTHSEKWLVCMIGEWVRSKVRCLFQECADLGGSCVEDVFYIVASAHLATQVCMYCMYTSK